jgi:hypothetical protein
MDISSIRNNLTSLSTQNVSSNASKLASSLSTGSAAKRLATLSASDSVSLTYANKTADLASLKSTMSQQEFALEQGSKAVYNTQTTLTDMKTDLEKASYTLQAYSNGKVSKDELAKVLTDYQSSYENDVDRIDQASTSSIFLTGSKMTLATANHSSFAVTVQGADLTSEGLKLKTKAAKDSTIANEDKPLVDQDVSQMVSAITGPNDTAALDKIAKALEAKRSAIFEAEGSTIPVAKSLSAGIDTIHTSSEHVTTMINSMSAGAKQARAVDMTEASATTLSRKTSTLIGSSGASFAGQSDLAMIQKLFK